MFEIWCLRIKSDTLSRLSFQIADLISTSDSFPDPVTDRRSLLIAAPARPLLRSRKYRSSAAGPRYKPNRRFGNSSQIRKIILKEQNAERKPQRESSEQNDFDFQLRLEHF